MSGEKTGYLLANTGTPDAPAQPAVRRYLAQFLNDPRVIDVAPLWRRILVHGIILRTRPKRSARAYHNIWTPEGSPLLVGAQRLAGALRERIAASPVAVGMRYGRPSLEEGLQSLLEAGASRIVVAPLFPQDAAATRGSILAACYRWAASRWRPPGLSVLPPYFDDPAYLDACAAHYGPLLEEAAAEQLVFSFHGLPLRHLEKSRAPGASCRLGEDCCSPLTERNRACYRAQCVAAASQLADRLGRGPADYVVSFQSRMGRAEWTAPPTFETLRAMAAQGVKRVAVLCPGFAADCLETLEEIAAAGREVFLQAGGEAYAYLPCLNESAPWADALAGMLRRV
jgi:ferrochelatase